MRRARRTNADINIIHEQYLTLVGSGLSQPEMAKKLDISVSTVTRWSKGKIPLPDANPQDNRYYYMKSIGVSVEEKLTSQEQILQEDTFDAQRLNMTLEDYRTVYASAMEKIQLLIKNDSTLGETLRSWLDYPERTVIDSQF